MKLDTLVPSGRPLSGKAIIQVMTKFVVPNSTGIAILNPFRKQSNVFIFTAKIACHNAYNLKIDNRQYLRWYFLQANCVRFVLKKKKVC